MKNKKWSKLVQIGKNTEKAHTESTEIHRKNKFSHRKHGNTQKRSSHRKHGNTQKFFCAVGDFLSHTEITEITEGLKYGKTKAQRSHGRVDCLG